MEKITTYFHSTSNSVLGQEICLESSKKLHFRMIQPFIGNHILIYDGDNKVASIQGNNVEIFGSTLPIKKLDVFKWAWELQNKSLLEPIGQEYWLNSKFVARVTRNEGLLNWLIEIIKNSSFRRYKNFITISYNPLKLEPLFALILLAVEISE